MTLSGRSAIATATGILLAWLFLAAEPASAKIKLPGIFGDNMVLQSDVSAPIWGWGAPEEEVAVSLGVRKVGTTADAKGKWMVKLPAMKPGGPYRLTIAGENVIRFKDVLVGEVWLCAGQENMELPLYQAPAGRKEVAAAKYPQIRFYRMSRRTSGLPARDVKTDWVPCTAKTASYFSAIGYYFGRKLHREFNVPIGLISVCWSGAKIEAWTPAAAFLAVPKLQQTFISIIEANKKYNEAMVKALPEIEAWVKDSREAMAKGQPLPAMPAMPKHELDSSWQPTSIYNGMVHPIAGFGLRGAIWFQGSANRRDGAIYQQKMQALINGWRKAWTEVPGVPKAGDFPIYFVQPTPYRDSRYPNATAKLWEAQRAALAMANTGMVVTTDIANKRYRHRISSPREVARRLSLWALAKTYGRKGLVFSGPLYKSMQVQDGKIRISFSHVGGGLSSGESGGPLTNFQIAGADNKFVKAKAEIDGREVVVSSDKITAPVAVRFGWDEKAGMNLFNSDGLPASAFRGQKQ